MLLLVIGQLYFDEWGYVKITVKSKKTFLKIAKFRTPIYSHGLHVVCLLDTAHEIGLSCGLVHVIRTNHL